MNVVIFAGNLNVGQVFPAALDISSKLEAFATAVKASVDIEIPDLTAELGELKLDLEANALAIGGISATIAAGPALAIGAAIQSIVSGAALLSLNASGPALLDSLKASLAQLTSKAASIGAKIAVNAKKFQNVGIRAALVGPALDFVGGLKLQMASPGVRLYVYSGDAQSVGSEVQDSANRTSGLAPDAPVKAYVMLVDNPAAAAAIEKLLGLL